MGAGRSPDFGVGTSQAGEGLWGPESPFVVRTDAPASPAVRCRRHTWAAHHGRAFGHGGFKVSVAEARTPLPFLLTTKSRNCSRRKPWGGLATGVQRSLRFVISGDSAPPPPSGVCRQTPSRLPGVPSVLTEAFPPPEDAAGGLPSVFAPVRSLGLAPPCPPREFVSPASPAHGSRANSVRLFTSHW